VVIKPRRDLLFTVLLCLNRWGIHFPLEMKQYLLRWF
jgi:hypothetical protein